MDKRHIKTFPKLKVMVKHHANLKQNEYEKEFSS